MVTLNKRAFVYMGLSPIAMFLIYMGLAGPVVDLSVSIRCRHSRVGSWVLVRGMVVFIGARCMPVRVAQLIITHA